MSAGWDALTQAVKDANALVAAAAPDATTAAEGEAYVTRVMAVGLGSAMLGHLFRQDGLSRALPCYGGPNPDYIMRFAPVTPDGRYRFEGRLNGSERVGIGLYTIGPNGAPLIAGYAAFDASNCGADGSFALDIGDGAEAEGGLPIQPGTRIVMARVLHRDSASDPANLRFTGGPPDTGLALAMGSNDTTLTFVANAMGNNVREYLKWAQAARALPNRLDIAPPELTATVQGDADTHYFLGGYDLAPDEWLEVTMPAGMVGYWSLHAYNVWYEHLQVPGAHDRNTTADPDGRIRIAVGPQLPDSAENRIDTLGRSKGAFVCRIIGGNPSCPQTTVRKLG